MFFGPVFYFDLVRVSRRGRYILLRFLYVLFLAVLLGLVYRNWFMYLEANTIRRSDMADFAESFFGTFMTVQFVALCFLTPAFTAGAISEEKERRTLEFILATDLKDREIILGKLASRMANLALLWLAGLPFLSFLQFLGGVDPLLVLAGFVATGMTMFSLAGLSLLNSVLCRKSRDAIVFTYLGAVAYLSLSGLSWLLLIPNYGLANFPSTESWDSPVTVTDLVHWLNAGNIFSALSRMFSTMSRGGIYDLIPHLLGGYVIFHGLVGTACMVRAILLVRRQALKESAGPSKRKARAQRVRRRPPIGNHPMIWKESYSDMGVRPGVFHTIIIVVLIISSFVPAIWITVYFLVYEWNHPNRWRQYSEAMGWMVRIMGTLVTCLTLLGVAVRASATITMEREKQTLDALYTTPMDSNEILYGKWLGSIMAMRWGWIWVAMMLFIGVVVGGVHVLAVPLLVAAWAVYAAFMASLGTWYTAVSRSTGRANVSTVFTALAVFFGHYLLWVCCCIPARMFGGQGSEWIAIFQAFGLCPPVTLGFLAFNGSEFENHGYRSNEYTIWMLFSSLIGLVIYAVAAGMIWTAASQRFRVMSGRAPLKPPQTRQPPAEPSQPTDNPAT